MQIPAAFAVVIVIWSTTPLAIQWSSEGQGFLFGVLGRMTLGALLCLAIVRVMGIALPWHRRARHAYLAAAVGVYGAMLSVYWGAQFIPSGVVSVLFGLTPIATGVLAAIWIGERALTATRITGLLLAVSGLAVVFGSSFTLGEQAIFGLSAVLLAVCLHAISAVWVKQVNVELSPIAVTTGALLIAVPLYLITWVLFDGTLPALFPPRAIAATLYLGVFGSVIGFILYFYLLKHLEASRASLLTLITPVLALILGQTLNGENVGLEVWLGSLIILIGLMSHEWGEYLVKKVSQKSIGR